MTPVEWLLAGAVVFAGTALQTATGAGLGLVAAPVLLMVMGSADAVTVSVVLNLVISLAMMPSEHGEVDWPVLKPLLIGTVLGIPLGLAALHLVEVPVLKLAGGLCVTFAAVYSLLERKRRTRGAVTALRPAASGSVGVVAGVMTGSLGMPGPAAMWALGRGAICAGAVRAPQRPPKSGSKKL